MFVPPHSSHEQLPPWLPKKSGLHRIRATPTVAPGPAWPGDSLPRIGRLFRLQPVVAAARPPAGWQLSARKTPTAGTGSSLGARHRSDPGSLERSGYCVSLVPEHRVLPARLGMTVAVLLNAQHPGAPVGPMPGTQAVIGHPGVVTTRTRPGPERSPHDELAKRGSRCRRTQPHAAPTGPRRTPNPSHPARKDVSAPRLYEVSRDSVFEGNLKGRPTKPRNARSITLY